MITADFNLGGQGNTVASSDAGSSTAWDLVTIGTGGTVIYDNAHAYNAMAAKFVTTNAVASFLEWNTAFGTQTDHYGRLYMYISSLTVNLPVIKGLSGASQAYGVRINGASKLVQLTNSGNIVQSSSVGTINTGQWYRFEWHIVHNATTGTMTFNIYANADSTVITETVSATNVTNLASSNKIDFGPSGLNANTPAFWIDNIVAAASSFPGRATAPSLMTLGVG